MENNLTSADPLSYTTNGFRGHLENRVSASCLLTLDSNPTASCGAPDHRKVEDEVYRKESATNSYTHKHIRRHSRTIHKYIF